jgi:hypothetical protein
MFMRLAANAKRSTSGATAGPPPGAPPVCPASDRAVDWIRLVDVAERACCCPARPVAVAVFPPQAGRSRPVDLLLCGHHYRESRATLAELGAIIYHLPRKAGHRD